MSHHLAGAAEVASLLGVTRQRVHQLSERADFPKPEVELEAGHIWLTDDIERWRDRLNSSIAVPPRDPERPQDDPWDADVVRYLLAQPGVASSWKRGALMECLRGQGNRRRKTPQRVDEAERLARQHGIEIRHEGHVRHFYRTDAAAPEYPTSPEERRRLLRNA